MRREMLRGRVVSAGVNPGHGALWRFGRFIARHRWWVIAAWVILIIGVAVASGRLNAHENNNFNIPGTDTQRGLDVLEKDFPELAQASAQLVIHAKNGTLDAPETKSEVEKALAAVAKLDHVATVSDPYDPSTGATVSKDGSTALVSVTYDESIARLGAPAAKKLSEAVAPADGDALEIIVAGQLVELTQPAQTDYSSMIGIVAAVIILILLFGSIVSMLVPIANALIGVGTGLILLMVLAAFIDIPITGPIVGLMIGLGVGIDYSLFIVSRYREHLGHDENADPVDSIAAAIASSGRAVLVAGTTVIVSLMGLLIIQIPIISAMAYSAAIVVFIAICAAMTLLPALLGFCGRKIFSLRIPFLHRRATRKGGDVDDSPFWTRWSNHVTSHAVVYLIGAFVVLVVLALPVLWIQIGPETDESLPEGSPLRNAYELIKEDFGPGYNNQVLVVAELPPNDPTANAAVESLIDAIKKADNVVAVSPPTFDKAGDTVVFTVTPSIDGTDPKAPEFVKNLRENVVPGVVDKETGGKLTVYLTGLAAAYVDIDERLGGRLVWFILVVIAIAFLLLMVVFRSLFIPLKAAILNLLSIGAAYGVLVAIFQWGWGLSLLGIDETMPIVSFVPVIMFAILFGLSMDYEVFILTRVHEEYVRTGDNRLAVANGLAKTAKLVTSAAAIMICVFLAFVLVDNSIVKMVGIGLAVSVLIDATITRMILVPSAMELAGRANWWLPRWLDRIIPRIQLEESSQEPLGAPNADAPVNA